MRSLLLSDVPDEVVDRLEQWAVFAGLPLEQYVVEFLVAQFSGADKTAALAALPDTGVSAETIVNEVHAARQGRTEHLLRISKP